MEFRDPFAQAQPRQSSYSRASSASADQAVTYDAGLRAYMLRIYNYMASALALTGLVSLLVANTPALMAAFYVANPVTHHVGPSGLWWLTFFACLGVSFWVNIGILRMSLITAQTLFWAYAGLFGVMLSSILLEFTGASIARTFFVTAIMFGSMSLYGYTTKRDLTAMGHFLIMGMWGVFLAIIVNAFLRSPAVDFALSIGGVVVFTGLAAYSTQNLKAIYYQISGNAEMVAKISIIGALSLYAEFMNIFLFLLRFMGDRR